MGTLRQDTDAPRGGGTGRVAVELARRGHSVTGNVVIFLDPGTERRVVAALARRFAPNGLLVAGFSIRPDRLQLEEDDRLAGGAGLLASSRWATWDREPCDGGDYAVSVHGRAAVGAPTT